MNDPMVERASEPPDTAARLDRIEAMMQQGGAALASRLARLDRMEATLAIQQLPIRYALAVDSRDIDAWTALFVEDVDCGRFGKGRAALRGTIEPALKTFYRSVHLVCGHRIDHADAGHATGWVYCRAEHETAEGWIVMAICYFDEYAQRDGDWLFVRRRERHWYAHDVLERPAAPFLGWSQSPPPKLPQAFATWTGFWEGVDEAQIGRLTDLPVRGSDKA